MRITNILVKVELSLFTVFLHNLANKPPTTGKNKQQEVGHLLFKRLDKKDSTLTNFNQKSWFLIYNQPLLVIGYRYSKFRLVPPCFFVSLAKPARAPKCDRNGTSFFVK